MVLFYYYFLTFYFFSNFIFVTLLWFSDSKKFDIALLFFLLIYSFSRRSSITNILKILFCYRIILKTSAIYLLPLLYFKPWLFQPSSNWFPYPSIPSIFVHSPCCLCNLKTMNRSLSHVKNLGGNLLNRPKGPHISFRSLYFSLSSAPSILALHSVYPSATNIAIFCL